MKKLLIGFCFLVIPSLFGMNQRTTLYNSEESSNSSSQSTNDQQSLFSLQKHNSNFSKEALGLFNQKAIDSKPHQDVYNACVLFQLLKNLNQQEIFSLDDKDPETVAINYFSELWKKKKQLETKNQELENVKENFEKEKPKIQWKSFQGGLLAGLIIWCAMYFAGPKILNYFNYQHLHYPSWYPYN